MSSERDQFQRHAGARTQGVEAGDVAVSVEARQAGLHFADRRESGAQRVFGAHSARAFRCHSQLDEGAEQRTRAAHPG